MVSLHRGAASILSAVFKSLTPEEIQALWELEPLGCVKKINYGFVVVPKDRQAIKSVTDKIAKSVKRLLAKCQKLNEARALEKWLKPEITIELS